MGEMNNYNGMNNAYESSYTVPGYNGMTPEPMTKESRGLEIATLVFGILALLICCCNGLFGLIGLVLGIIAIVKGKRTGMTIAGLVCSVLGVLGAIFVLIFGMTDYGQELQDAFWEGFEQGYESTSGEDINIGEEEQFDETDEYMGDSVEAHEGIGSLSDKVAARLVIDGEEIKIPCKLSTILELYEVSEYSENDADGVLGSYESRTIFLAKNGEECGICVDVQNYTDDELADVKDGNVGMISLDSAPEKDVEVFGGLKLGMTTSQVEEVLKELRYNKSEMSGYIFYNVYAGDDSDYSLSVMLSEGVVSNITLYYTD